MGYQIQMRGPGRQSDTTPPASSYDLGQKVRAAGWLGIFVAVLLTVVGYVVFSLATLADHPARWELWLGWAVVCSVVGLLTTCWHGIGWVMRVAVRPWAVDDDEREYRRALARKKRKQEEEAAEEAEEQIRRGPMDHDGIPDTLTMEQRLHLVALRMLERAYLGRGSPTREAMCKAGVCNQPQWNLVTQGMKKLRLKRDHTWQAATFEEAWAHWSENFKVEAGDEGEIYAWAQVRQGDWKAFDRVA